MAQKYYWLKLHRDFFKRHDVRIVEAQKNGKDYVLFYLKLLCESIDHEGRLKFNDSLPYNEEMLATITDTNIDIVRSAVNIFTGLGLMEILDDGTYYLSEVQYMTGSASSNPGAIRQQRHRDKIKYQPVLPYTNESVTKSNASVTECVTKNNVEIEIDNKSKSKIKKENILKEKKSVSEVPTKHVMGVDEHEKAIRFMEHFNSIEGVTPCLKMLASREINISTILSHFSDEEVERSFLNLSRSPFLLGKERDRNGNIFNASLDWFINIDNFTKVFEGNYVVKAETEVMEESEPTPEMYLNQKGVN